MHISRDLSRGFRFVMQELIYEESGCFFVKNSAILVWLVDHVGLDGTTGEYLSDKFEHEGIEDMWTLNEWMNGADGGYQEKLNELKRIVDQEGDHGDVQSLKEGHVMRIWWELDKQKLIHSDDVEEPSERPRRANIGRQGEVSVSGITAKNKGW